MISRSRTGELVNFLEELNILLPNTELADVHLISNETG
jgi:hypothetical protein